jgi:hypothetical protein
MKLEIILRTHDQSNVHTDRQRYCGFDKKTLILGCLTSLIKSSNLVFNHEVNFKILDDHSSPEFIEQVHNVFNGCKWPYELYNLSQTGYNYSALKQFEYCRDSEADLVYSVEDDYLHCPSALAEMLESYELFKAKSGQEVVMYPFDMPDDYVPPHMQPCFVVHGSHRHWKTGIWTTNTFMLRPQVLIDHWPVFEKLATQYDPDYSRPGEHIHEGNTICNIWKDHALRFSPVQSLALHMQFDTQMDPYINWEQWWKDYT